jgi:single-strand DNA-binding protein
MYLNKAFIIGNLTRDPEIKALPSGNKVCTFGIATNRTYKDKDGNRQDTAEFHNIVVFGRVAELVAQFLKKGSQALVEGRLQTRSWDDKQTGTKKYRTEIVADTVQFGNRSSGAGGAGKGPEAVSGGAAPGEASGDASPSDGQSGKDSGEKIDYPQEEINPDDIPF